MPIIFGIVAGEASGDQLGASLMVALRERFPEAIFEGVGGPKMIAEGFKSFYPIERLSVMGFVEPLKRLPELLKMRGSLYKHFRDNPPAVFLGIDSPDFTLRLEGRLRKRGIATVHYVSPSVWAWRQGRVKKIAKSVDHILTLFPFESKFYIEHNIPVTCVGHPLADSLPMVNDTEAARLSLGLENDRPVVAVLPGSRGSEVASLGELFLQAASWLNSRLDSVQFVIPAANSQRRQQIDELLNQFQSLNVKVLDGNSLQAMAAADVVLMASGTVTLEAMLLKKPMVVSYRFGKLTYAIFSRLIKTPFASLPNLLAGRALVPELIQNDATVENIGSAVLDFLDNPQRTNDLKTEFVKLHNMLRRNASQVAANVIAELVAQKNG